jgi:hypothetical protein
VGADQRRRAARHRRRAAPTVRPDATTIESGCRRTAGG